MNENSSSKCRFRDWCDDGTANKLPVKRIATGKNQATSGTTRFDFEYGGDQISIDDCIHLQNGYTEPLPQQFPSYVEPLSVYDPHGFSPEYNSSEENCSDGKADNSDFQENGHLDLDDTTDDIPSSSQFDIASSSNKEVKISLSRSSYRNRFFQKQNINTVLRVVEDEYRRMYRIQDPGFSLLKMMERVCDCFLESEVNSRNGSLRRNFDSTKKPGCKVGAKGDNDQGKHSTKHNHSNGIACHPNIVQGLRALSHMDSSTSSSTSDPANGESKKVVKVEALKNRQSINLHSIKAVVGKKHPIYIQDIARGLEKMRIPLVNEYGALELPNFLYIKNNMVHKDAHIDFSLARISEDNFCGQCIGDCLSSALPCACAGETRGEFAYTQEGLLKEEFLDECIAMSREPERKYFYFCEICPLQNDLYSKKSRRIKPCKGHLSRRFVKECWSKCGCSKKCRNRVVQKGIQVALQVYAAGEGKGWGVRSVNALKKGTFICEYIGEIVTNQELYDRNTERALKQEKHTYPVLLDADWGSERMLKDEEALCLDATEFGNVGRFVNHRCHDPNLVEIPVEVETPDHHYYHLAFFTSKDIEPMEELTWDYGIEFDDKYHPIKAFKCKCGSSNCRDRT
ncbi:histone-lysine N-methyltransferase SUVR4-like isoform X2 [Mercurialis annua]|uniref:histone-lysine N-methyltransferase SUVR4-like isoform X2 n=1 Tax=Mercurialis annua TaxID=3986 RepID=UPI00215EDE4D|nr:histone-lysine N-methyltransferase SUVR4-like isoform X2 [Mercurialis annua]